MDDVQSILAELVAIDTTNPPGRNYQIIADVVASYLYDICDSVEIVGSDEERPNVVATIGNEKGPSVAFNGHVDVVPTSPENWDYPPFELTVDGHKGYGRGTVDMKGGLAAGIKTMDLLSARSFPGSVTLTATINEETGGEYGLKWLLENQVVDADYWIINEPTNLDIYRCEKGAFWHRVDIQGESAHGSRPHLGTNAIDIAADAITAIQSLTFDYAKSHEILDKPSINVGRIDGGTNINSVPDRCWFEVDRRIVPGEAIDDVFSETAQIMSGLRESYDFTYNIEEIMTAQPFEMSADSIIVQSACTAVETVCQTPPVISGTSGYTDARFPAVLSNRPTIILGPGDNSLSHVTNEHIDLRHLERTPPVLAAVAEDLLTQ